jgi:hypothetical protein
MHQEQCRNLYKTYNTYILRREVLPSGAYHATSYLHLDRNVCGLHPTQLLLSPPDGLLVWVFAGVGLCTAW